MSQSYETKGIIHSIGQVQEFSGGFTKREFVVLLSGEGENPEYPNYVAFTLVKDKCVILDAFQAGNEVKITFNLSGRLWAGNGDGEKCFVDLQAWKVELLHIGQQQQQAPPQQPPQQRPPQQPPAQNFDVQVTEYLSAGSVRQQGIWDAASEPLRAAINAACS